MGKSLKNELEKIDEKQKNPSKKRCRSFTFREKSFMQFENVVM